MSAATARRIGQNLAGWPKYDLSRRATMRFDIASEIVDDPRS
jgi:carboxylesterase type B